MEEKGENEITSTLLWQSRYDRSRQRDISFGQNVKLGLFIFYIFGFLLSLSLFAWFVNR